MANFTLRNFKSEVLSRGLSKPNRFEIVITVPSGLSDAFSPKEGKLVSLFCETTNLPPQFIGVRQQRIYGPAYQRPYAVEYGGEGITMTFLIDQQMDVKAFFDAWVSKIVDPFQYFVYYPSTYIANTIEIHQLNDKNQYEYSIYLEDAFPRSVSLVELNNAAQNQVNRLNVTFAYRRWAPGHRLTSRMTYPVTINTAQGTYRRFGDTQADVRKADIYETFSDPADRSGELINPADLR